MAVSLSCEHSRGKQKKYMVKYVISRQSLVFLCEESSYFASFRRRGVLGNDEVFLDALRRLLMFVGGALFLPKACLCRYFLCVSIFPRISPTSPQAASSRYCLPSNRLPIPQNPQHILPLLPFLFPIPLAFLCPDLFFSDHHVIEPFIPTLALES